jgi:hypothetical protein
LRSRPQADVIVEFITNGNNYRVPGRDAGNAPKRRCPANSNGICIAYLRESIRYWIAFLLEPKEVTKMKAIVMFGAVLALLGLIAFAMPSFNTEETKDVVKLGDLKVQAKTEEPHFIPPIVSGGAMVLGILLIGAGMVMNRQ